MKKKIKLFSTIASLCLAVALMAFGVWAATEAGMKVGSTVTFHSANVNVKYTITVAYTNGKVTPADVVGATTEAAGLNTWEKEITKAAKADEAAEAANTFALGTYKFNSDLQVADQNVTTVVYTIKIENLGDHAVKVTAPETLPTNTEGNSIKVEVDTSKATVDLAAKTEEATAAYELKITYTLVDATKDSANQTFELAYTVVEA